MQLLARVGEADRECARFLFVDGNREVGVGVRECSFYVSSCDSRFRLYDPFCPAGQIDPLFQAECEYQNDACYDEHAGYGEEDFSVGDYIHTFLFFINTRNNVLVIVIAENILTTTPMKSVSANPRTKLEVK